MERTALRENWPNIMFLFHWSGKFPFCSLNCHLSLCPTPSPSPSTGGEALASLRRVVVGWRDAWRFRLSFKEKVRRFWKLVSVATIFKVTWKKQTHCCTSTIILLVFIVSVCYQQTISFYNFLLFIGFKLGSLNRIIDTKSSSNSKITLLHYLIMVLERKVKSLRISNKWTPTTTVSTWFGCFALQTHIT